MALLKNMTTNEVLQLQHKHLFGSAYQWVDTLLIDKNIAPIHAVIFFKENSWQLECLAPIGHFEVFHNDNAISNGNSIRLEIGSIISFASNCQDWRLINTDSPKYFLHAVHTRDLFIELGQSVDLPRIGENKFSIQHKNGNKWYCEKSGHNYELKEGAVLVFDNEIWRFTAQLPVGFIYNSALTKNNHQLPLFWIYVSKDEEHVQIKIDFNSTLYDLGERAHHYLLLLLARKRRDDITARYDSHTQGWIDVEEIAKQLKIEPNVLNMQITRVRRQIKSYQNQIPPLNQDVIERRHKQLRFGFSNFKIFRGSELENN